MTPVTRSSTSYSSASIEGSFLSDRLTKPSPSGVHEVENANNELNSNSSAKQPIQESYNSLSGAPLLSNKQVMGIINQVASYQDNKGDNINEPQKQIEDNDIGNVIKACSQSLQLIKKGQSKTLAKFSDYIVMAVAANFTKDSLKTKNLFGDDYSSPSLDLVQSLLTLDRALIEVSKKTKNPDVFFNKFLENFYTRICERVNLNTLDLKASDAVDVISKMCIDEASEIKNNLFYFNQTFASLNRLMTLTKQSDGRIPLDIIMLLDKANSSVLRNAHLIGIKGFIPFIDRITSDISNLINKKVHALEKGQDSKNAFFDEKALEHALKLININEVQFERTLVSNINNSNQDKESMRSMALANNKDLSTIRINSAKTNDAISASKVTTKNQKDLSSALTRNLIIEDAIKHRTQSEFNAREHANKMASDERKAQFEIMKENLRRQADLQAQREKQQSELSLNMMQNQAKIQGISMLSAERERSQIRNIDAMKNKEKEPEQYPAIDDYPLGKPGADEYYLEDYQSPEANSQDKQNEYPDQDDQSYLDKLRPPVTTPINPNQHNAFMNTVAVQAQPDLDIKPKEVHSFFSPFREDKATGNSADKKVSIIPMPSEIASKPSPPKSACNGGTCGHNHDHNHNHHDHNDGHSHISNLNNKNDNATQVTFAR